MKNKFRRIVCAALLLSLTALSAGATNWGLSYNNGVNQPPTGEDTVEKLAQYGAYFRGDSAQKTVYLTFDCGYENGNTAKILDTLKKHHAPACFFVVKEFLRAAPDLAKRMGNEGHLVGNHTANHPNITKISYDRLASELQTVKTQYKEVTGRDLDPFMRPPEGSYSYDALRQVQQHGYYTMLWSVAHMDYDEKAQPSRETALQTLNARVHNGAVVLLHVTSRTNATILDELLTGWEAKGYEFGYLTALPGMANPPAAGAPSASAFTVAGTPAAPTAYVIADQNYLKLRDLAQALAGTAKSFAVAYDGASNTVQLTSGTAYAPLGTELAGTPDVAAVAATQSTLPFTMDGAPTAWTAYCIGGANYVRLRDVAKAIDCAVTYDPATQAVGLDPTQPYTA